MAEVIEQQAVGKMVQDVPILREIFVARDPGLLQEFVGRQDTAPQAFGVVGHSLRVEPTSGARQFGCVVGWRRQRERGL